MKNAFCVEFTDLNKQSQQNLVNEVSKFMPNVAIQVIENWLVDSALHNVNLPALAETIQEDLNQ